MYSLRSTLRPDPTQVAVLECRAPNLLVTAPPGRGKTLVAIWKAKAIIDSSMLEPWQKVLFLSFSRSAVAQVASTAQEVLSDGYRSYSEMATYHSFFFRVIEAYGRYVGLPPKVDLLWGPERRRLCRKLLREYGAQVLPGRHEDVYEWFGSLTPSSGAVRGIDHLCADLPQLAELAPVLAAAKESACQSTGKIHFDDFAYYANRILSESRRVCRAFGSAYPVIIADEFQDTSDEQWGILKLISEGRSLIAFADPHQLIFASFGASYTRLDDFRAERTPAELPLGVNYRMRPEIEEFAGQIASLAGGDLSTARPLPGGSVVTVGDARALQAEAYAIKWQINREISHGNTVGVLAPTNRDVAAISACLRKRTAKTRATYHHVIRETDDFPIAADAALALTELHASRNPRSLRRFGALLSCLCGQTQADCSELLPMCAPEGDSVSPGAARRPRGTCAKRAPLIWQQVSSFLEQPLARLGQMLEQAFSILGSIAETDRELRDALVGRLSDERSGLASAFAMYQNSTGREPDLDQLVENVRAGRMQAALLEDLRPAGRVRVMTMHKAKGREFDAVFVLGISDGNFPHATAFLNPQNLRDAVNLFYVAATRAKKRLHVSHLSGRPSKLLEPFLK